MTINIKFTKFDNTPWGFRLAGGSDFPQPLTVIRVTEESLAECMGIKVGDVVVRLNDQSISSLTHGQAHEALVHAGNNFVLGVQREEEARKAAEAISEENIVPYKIALADLPPVFPEQILKEETVIERYEEENTVAEPPLSVEEEIRQEEVKPVEEKPVDADSEIVPNKNLTDDEIAQLILEEEELLSDKGLLGVNFKKLRPRASILKDSKVLEELQHIAVAEPERVQELKRTSTFLQKPQRPVPKLKNEPQVKEDEGETYKVVIKKQDKKTVITRLIEKGLLPPGFIARTPEPPVPPEVKMHETENRLEENRPPAVSDLNSSCSTCSLDNTDNPLSSPRPLESDSNKSLTSEDQLAQHATYNCKSQLFYDKPDYVRRYSATGRNDDRRRSLFKGRYLENIFLGHSCALRDRQIAKSKKTHVFVFRMKGRYLTTYLRRESIRLVSLITALFQFLLQITGVSESSNSSKIQERRSSFKGRYLEHILQKNVTPVLECVKETYFIDDQQTDKDAADLKISEWHENGPCCRLQKELPLIINTSDNGDLNEEATESGHNVLKLNSNPVLFAGSTEITDTIPEEDDTLSKLLQSAENYVSTEVFHRGSRRFSKSRKSIDLTPKEDDNKALSNFLQAAEDYISGEVFHRRSRRFSKPRKSIDITSEEDDKALAKFLQLAEDYVSTEVFHRGSRRFSKSHNSIDITPKEDDNTLSKFLQSAEDYVSTELFHRGSRRLSKSRNSIDITLEEDDKALSKFLQSAENYVSTELFHRDSRRLSKSRNSIDITSKEDDKALSKFLQSAENYVSTELFHRGSRRLSKSRNSIDITSKEDDEALPKFLQSAEDYVSTELFHRGSRRLSKPRKSIIDITPKEDDNALSKFLQSAEDYVSAEVFHRRSRRLSKPRKSIDITSKEDDKALSKFLQSAEDYVSTELFHRGSRRLSKSRKSIDITPTEDDNALSKFLQSAENYVSTEVFHRGSRRFSRSFKQEEQGEEDVLSNVLRSTGDYVSGEVFHRGSRRLSKSYRRESVSLVTPTLWDGLKSKLNLPWFTEKSTESEDYEEKINPEIECDNRRLSFVPTILYQDITNRIGIDFTKLVVYAFIPCTSIILLYMYMNSHRHLTIIWW